LTSFRTKNNLNVEARVEGDAVRIIEYAHVAVHDDKFVIVSDYFDNLDIATPRVYLMVAPTELELHVLFQISTSAPVLIELVTGAVASANGTELLHLRPNLWSSAERITSYHTPTLTDAGTVRYKIFSGGTSGSNQNQSIGGGTRNGEEIIIPGGENLVLRVTATVNDTKFSIVGEYYEVPSGATAV
jgi:hypothetical protein